ncbi:hypothetical protein BT96DRAFT_851650 [Gymnopus androsaceus JB14]|uniref:DUF6534 domain-containing protein n=1 Tax=Gymnopus androsaceus JB14 TaxID=1447944 RepID=A0A6A4I6Y3_9AGAR|nr:hypothetical protein BT96DRAFT_851650 [Gymnopus androsaceus JB14]
MSNITNSVPLTALPLGINLSSSVDGIFYGYTLSTVLFGITIVQAWIYINTNDDKWPLRILVTALVLADFTTTCLDTQVLHHLLITNFGSLDVFTELPLSFMIETMLTIIIGVCAELFFISKVWLLKQLHWTVSVLMLVTCIGGAVAGIVAVVQDLEHPFVDFGLTHRAPRLATALNVGLTLLSNTITSTALCWSFANSRTGIKRTDTLLQKLFQYTVTRGIFVTVNLFLLLILFLVHPEELAWVPFHWSTSKVYVITMVAMLNSRDTLRKDLDRGAVITDSEMPANAPRSYINTGERIDPGVFGSLGRKANEAQDRRMMDILELENYNHISVLLNEQPLHQRV